MSANTFDLNRARTATYSFFFLCGIALSAWAPMVPYVKEHLSLNESEMGGMLLFLGAGAILMMPVCGWLIGRVGSRKVIMVATTITLISLPILLLTKTVAWTAFVLFCFGAGLGSIDIAINSQGVQIQNLYAKPIMSSLHGLFSVGGLVGPLMVILMFELQFSPVTVLILISLFLLAILITQWKFLLNYESEKDTTRRFASNTQTSTAKHFTWIDLRVFFLGALCFIVFLAEGAVLDWSAIYLRDYKFTEETMAGLGYASFSVAMAFMRLVGDRIVSKFPVRWIVVAGSMTTCAGFVISVYATWIPVVLIGFILVGLGAANIIPVFFSEGSRIPGIPSASALAAITTLGYVGQLAGPALLGFIAEMTSLSSAFGVTAGLMAIVGMAYLVKPEITSVPTNN